ncbi:amidase signature domain-containing protein [Naematelia encephala]|uniref:amidase n=1 Tax=Naematelia encephala TaxID=71784 RepID=A0A1Y2B3M7_9TREE|nr:amidase signature domain-containing protein [Naematelia encephala]
MVSVATKAIAAEKQAERERLVKEMEDELGLSEDHPDDQTYLLASPSEIVDNLKAHKEDWTVERVMRAWIRSACAVHRKTNALTEVLFREALGTARAMDQAYANGEAAEGEFWGLPSSFKDTYNIVGVDTSLGCSPHCFHPTETAEEEGGLVKLFRAAGGIPFCKSNIPQTLLAFECQNPVFGASTNPFDSTRVPGGSSGGEAVLVALRGTPLGWGTDVGGSLRIPAHFSGCCGLKPVLGRWPTCGSRVPTAGFEAIKTMVGPMTRSVTDLTFASKTMIGLAQKPDYLPRGEVLLPIPWREPEIPKKLRIGWWVEDDIVKTSPACSRAVQEVAQKLAKEGHEVVRWDPPEVAEALKVFAALTAADGYKSLLRNLGPDPMEPSMRLVTLGSKTPSVLRGLLVWLIGAVLKDTVFSSIFATSKPSKKISDFWAWTDRRNKYIQAFNKAAWEDHHFDMLLCPVQAVPALEHGRTKFLSPLAVTTILFNVVDSTVGVLPVTKVDRDLDATPPDFLHGSKGSWLLEKRVYGDDDPAYDADKMHGLPVGVQVVGRAWEEEKVLAMMKIVEDAVGFEAE